MPSISNRIFIPVRKIIERLLPEFVEQALDDPNVRDAIVERIDVTLLTEYPAARALPKELRMRMLHHILDHVLGEAGDERKKRRSGDDFSVEGLSLTQREMEMLEASAPGNSVRGFEIEAEPGAGDGIAGAVARVLGMGWEIKRLVSQFDFFQATSPEAILSVPEAWALAHALEDQPEVSLAGPEIEWVPSPPEIGGGAPDIETHIRRSAGGDSHLKCSTPETWHLDTVNALGAWKISRDAGRPEKGEGVTIGHLDTGLTHHAEVPLDAPTILVSKGRNMYDPDHPQVGNQPLDPMIGGFRNQPGHGTGTASMITGRVKLNGTAPNAKIIPYRISPSVVHFNANRIAEGIRQAHEDGCDVITMSMGGPPSATKYLDKIVALAAGDGVIICTAAGNQIGSNDTAYMVVWPAALDQVIAVAGCNCRDDVWDGSSRGPEVNITAAAQDVWHAYALSGALAPSPNPHTSVGRGNGTSFATPTVAGMAACWLAHHGGRDALAKYYGGRHYVPMAFAFLLRNSAFRRPPGWKTKLMGPGILDAEKLLAAPLPAKAALTGWPAKKHPWMGNLIGGIFIGLSSNRAAAGGIRRRSQSAEEDAGRFQSELAYHLFDRPRLAALIHDTQSATEVAAGVRRRNSIPRADTRLELAAELLRSVASQPLADALDP